MDRPEIPAFQYFRGVLWMVCLIPFCRCLHLERYLRRAVCLVRVESNFLQWERQRTG